MQIYTLRELDRVACGLFSPPSRIPAVGMNFLHLLGSQVFTYKQGNIKEHNAITCNVEHLARSCCEFSRNFIKSRIKTEKKPITWIHLSPSWQKFFFYFSMEICNLIKNKIVWKIAKFYHIYYYFMFLEFYVVWKQIFFLLEPTWLISKSFKCNDNFDFTILDHLSYYWFIYHH